MSKVLDIKVSGVERVLRALQDKVRQLPKAAQSGCMAGALVIEGAAKGNAPVRTGFLRNSISAKPIPLGAEVGPHAEYAVYQEYGTVKMPAHPYMRPALESKRKEVERIVGRTVKLELGKPS